MVAPSRSCGRCTGTPRARRAPTALCRSSASHRRDRPARRHQMRPCRARGMLCDPVLTREAGVEHAVGDVARHLLRADQHALDVGVVDGGEVRSCARVDVEAGAREELDRRVLERSLRQTEFEASHCSSSRAACVRPGSPVRSFQLSKEAGSLARVAHVAVAQALDLEQHGVLVAVLEDPAHFQPVPRRFPLRPQLAARAAEERGEARVARAGQRLFVHEADHQHVARAVVLDDGGNQDHRVL